MNRRHFLRNTSLAGVAVGAAAVTACQSANDRQPVQKEKNKTTSDTDDFVLNEVTIDQLQQKMKSGELSSRAITQLYLNRIEAMDKQGPALNAVIEINPDALSIADAMDKERAAGKVRSPLHGIPVLIKDNIDTGDQMMTTAGSLALMGHKAKQDAFIVQQLRNAGAVIMGKTNLSEWANFRSVRSTSGWSSRGGQTKCPYVLDRNPSGSSSGSGAAVAANLCAVAVGTETDGSVVSPAAVNGIVGMKPTVGLLSRSGIIPISKTQDTAGPMARSVRDAAILLGAMTGIDDHDTITKESKGKTYTDYTSFLDVNGLKGKKIGIEKNFLQGHPGMVTVYKEAIGIMKAQGAMVVEIELLKELNTIGSAEFEVLQFEFKDGLNKYLAAAGAGPASLAGVIDFNRKNESAAMPFFKQETLETSEAKGTLDDKTYKQALQKTLTTRKIIDGLIKIHGLDAVAATTNGMACCIDIVNGDYDTGFSFSTPAAMAGFPHITVPMGFVQELPVGLSFCAGAYQEALLFTMAYAFEQASRKRKAPRFINTSIPVHPVKAT